MKILAYKPGHDGSVAYIEDGTLVYSLEAEKDSDLRHMAMGADLFIDSLALTSSQPDAIALSGWSKGPDVYNQPIGAGYMGVDQVIVSDLSLLGSQTRYFSSSHERSHIFCAFGLSDLPQGQPCYALIWEAELGCFYEIDQNLKITKLGSLLNQPGNRYAFIYGLADSTFSDMAPAVRLSDAGKLMALASYSQRPAPTREEQDLMDLLLFKTARILPKLKGELVNSCYYNVGIEDPDFKNFAGIYSDRIFDIFYQFAKKHCTKKLPLIIAGGCGLNCDWNTLWRQSGLFSDVFVPPVANDSGSAIGTALDAYHHFTGKSKISWSVYAGLEFVVDAPKQLDRFEIVDVSYLDVAKMLAEGMIIAWVQGKYEIGPRALGNRSLLAAPFLDETRIRLNLIKQREQFRPIAPICLEEDAKIHFGCQESSPYMLYFYKVKTNKLAAVTHVDGTARIQTVSAASNPQIFKLLSAFKQVSGYGVLCNTSLNFKGKGFINTLSDLEKYVLGHGIDGFVVADKCYLVRESPCYRAYRNRYSTTV
jgi:predicted NodU family carbamoyl transferase